MLSRTLLVNAQGLEQARSLVTGYKQGRQVEMDSDLWHAKKVLDSTLHPGV